MNRLTIILASCGALLIAVFLGYVVFSFIGTDGQFRNVSHGMDSTLLAPETVSYSTVTEPDRAHIARGAIISHRWPEDRTKQFVKRVMGMPGDTLSMVNGILQVNGRAVREPYAWHADSTIDPVVDDFRWQRKYLVGDARRDTANYVASRNNWGPIVVPAGNYFLLGDNRDNSLDSRYWGFLPFEDVTGIVRRVRMSIDSVGRIRWRRLGHRVQ